MNLGFIYFINFVLNFVYNILFFLFVWSDVFGVFSYNSYASENSEGDIFEVFSDFNLCKRDCDFCVVYFLYVLTFWT